MPPEELPPEDLPSAPLVEIGRFRRLKTARVHGLVIAAMGSPHWIERDGREYVLLVEETMRARAAAAVAEFNREERDRPRSPRLDPLRIPKPAVMAALATMAVCYRLQMIAPPALVERGVAADGAIRAGEWWRVFTALTLHGGIEHIVSNISLAVFALAFVLWRFGVGAGLLGTVLGGGLGNLLNAYAHVAKAHHSIGSSTALFASLGLLTGGELAARLMHRATRTGWHLFVPIGAGLAFLALFGGGGTNRDGAPAPDAGTVDVMAHLFGLAAGILLGAVFFVTGMRGGAPRWVQSACGATAIGLLVVPWLLAAPPR
jgi:membrane associated rhomboid family serine protease